MDGMSVSILNRKVCQKNKTKDIVFILSLVSSSPPLLSLFSNLLMVILFSLGRRKEDGEQDEAEEIPLNKQQSREENNKIVEYCFKKLFLPPLHRVIG